MNFFIALLMGHLFGDFMFQNKWMAMNKSGKWFPALVHCIIYSLTVAIFTFYFTHSWFIWPIIVFATHFPIDYWSIADKWLWLIGGRDMNGFYLYGHRDIPKDLDYDGISRELNYRMLRGGFTCVVYTVVDNTMHLALMLGAAILLGYI